MLQFHINSSTQPEAAEQCRHAEHHNIMDALTELDFDYEFRVHEPPQHRKLNTSTNSLPEDHLQHHSPRHGARSRTQKYTADRYSSTRSMKALSIHTIQ